ncbi:MAG: sensor histidine kinase [Actinomycetales bacterium]
MSTLGELLAVHCDVEPAHAQWLYRLLGHWQVLADLAYTDLLLWASTRDGQLVVLGLCRPATASTGYVSDPVGRVLDPAGYPEVASALTGVPMATSASDGDPERPPVEAEPVVCGGEVIAAVTLRQRRSSLKISPLERAYLRAADDLVLMMREGDFPNSQAPSSHRRGGPRVGDGLIRLDADGMVNFASPNALSSFHRLGYIGGLVGELLAIIATEYSDPSGLVDEALPLVVTGRAPLEATLLSSRDVAVTLRAIPLTQGGVRMGALVLCRDVTEMHRGEQELMTKDATIREIHHRVKNNLQTVSALLRMQARRMDSLDAREALEEAMRRVATIALVHETLSVALDEVLDLNELLSKVLALVRPLAWTGGDSDVVVRQIGHGGEVPAKEANALALVVMELVANAIEHAGTPGKPPVVTVTMERVEQQLSVSVADNGPGLPPRFAPGEAGLGTQIVSALVSGELKGNIEWLTATGGGSLVRVSCVVGRIPARSEPVAQ